MKLQTVVVQNGDTVYNLARQYMPNHPLGLDAAARDLWMVNLPFIVDDPNYANIDEISPRLIFPGMELVVPRGKMFDPSANE